MIRRILTHATLLCALGAGTVPAAARQQQQQPAAQPAATPNSTAPKTPQKIVKEGIEVEFTVEPATAEGGEKKVVAGKEAVVRFRVSDTATRTPVSGVRPAAWMSLRDAGVAVDGAAQCKERVQSFVQGSLRARPDVDLNSYYVLALNQEANISVIDPLLGFGGSKLLTLVMLKSPGEDWALTADGTRLFVSMPLVGQVAVVDTSTWKVVENVDVGGRPVRIALQPDGKYLWVGDDERGAALAVDAASLRVTARVAVGAGRHELAFSDDNKFAYVTNADAGTLSVVDVRALARVADVKTGESATSLAYSPLSRAVYVGDEKGGGVTVVDGARHTVLARMTTAPGLKGVRFAPGGRYGFVPSPSESAVLVFDASSNRVIHSAAVGRKPDQVAFTGAFAYVRSLGTEEVSAIRLGTVGKELDIVKFPGGQLAPSAASAAAGTADSIVPTPEGNSVLLANPADKMIYYYSEGMAAPMGNFQNYRREPRSVRVVDRSLREVARGEYSASVKLPKSGAYTVSFLLDSPRIVHCFEAEAAPNPSLKDERKTALRIEYLTKERQLAVGRDYKLRFKLSDTETGKPVADLGDARVLVFLAPGVWQRRDIARHVGEGVYEVNVNVPQSGVYLVFVESQSRGVTYRQLPYLTLQAATPEATTTNGK